jgi:hypothetical protein
MKSDSKSSSQCYKIFYNFNGGDKHILLAHHFHKIKGEYKEMVRIMTYAVPEEKIEIVFYKALQYLELQPSRAGDESPGGFVFQSPAPVPHPKAILCSMLESLEEKCRKDLARDRKIIIEKIEADIKDQRDPERMKPKGLEINYVKLSDARIRLGEVRQKLQYLESSIASLEETYGLPGPCQRWSPMCSKQKQNRDDSTPEDQLSQKWWCQLREVESRLSSLKVKCKQHKINIENLQERVQGILCIVKAFLSELEYHMPNCVLGIHPPRRKGKRIQPPIRPQPPGKRNISDEDAEAAGAHCK